MSAPVEERGKTSEALKEKNGPVMDGKGSDISAAEQAQKSENITESGEKTKPILDKAGELGRAETTPEQSDIANTVKDGREESSHGVVLYEAALEFTSLERSKETAKKLTVISAVVTIIAIILFIFSFPLSLFLILFCFNTRRSCSPFKAVKDSPWRLYLTKNAILYHLPKPPHRPYINVFYCIHRVHKIAIPLKDIRQVSVQSVSNKHNGRERSASAIAVQMENIVFELKSSSDGVRAPVRDYLGLLSKYETVYTLVIYSVRDASTFVGIVKEHMAKNKKIPEN